MDRALRTLFLWLSRNAWLRQMVTQVRLVYRLARRFIAGETVAEALAAVRDLRATGVLSTLDILGEEVASRDEAAQARDDYLDLLDQIQAAGIASDISLKLTQVGLDIELDLCVQHVAAIVSRARDLGILVCIDMEDSARTERTLEVWRRLHAEHPNVGVVIQAYLYRSAADVEMLCRAGATVRLCKGAYKEPPEVAFPGKSEVDANMVRLMQMMLDATVNQPAAARPYLAMATHDEKMVAATRAYADRLGVPRDAFEFQMLYGIRRDMQEQLSAAGYQMRAYVPFGTHWYPYFMRRLAERPANLWFLLRALLKESPEVGSVLLLAALATGLLIWVLRSLCARSGERS